MQPINPEPEPVPVVGDGLDELRAELARHGSREMTDEEADKIQVFFMPPAPKPTQGNEADKGGK